MSKVKAYIHLDMYEKDGQIHINSAGQGDAQDLVVLVAYLINDKPELIELGKQEALQNIVMDNRQ